MKGLTIAAALSPICLTACAISAPPYPSELPAAESVGPCPDLTGTFENIGVPVGKEQDPGATLALTNVLLAPNVLAPDVHVASVRLRGPQQNQLEVTALALSGPVAQLTLPGGTSAAEFLQSKPFTRFLCIAKHVEMTNTPPNVVAKAHTMGYMLSHATSSMLYRAKDGALLVSWQQNDVSGVVFSVKGRWYRFRVVAKAP